MDSISVRQLRTESAAVWDALAESKDLVVTSNGKPIALLSAVSATTLEASLAALRQARAQLAVAAMQQCANETGADRLTLVDLNAEIEAVRRELPPER
ncbi:MAG: type II toxin-antitoxin system Phd/YefM family antitoxin [Gammaproteobacteria bacterium]|nr:type II toxin-antitoxin system Phd/YefM family antitoxin [Gammaproteobacteria bacterium]